MTEPGEAACIVVGGGLLGLLSAYTLQQAGIGVILLERGEVCREASWAGGGILSPLFPWRYPEAVTTLVRWSQRRFPELAASLRAETGIDAQWLRSGLLMPGMQGDPAIRDWAQSHEYRLCEVEPAELPSLEPQLGCVVSGQPRSAILLPDVAQIRNPRLCRALRESLRRHGVQIREHTAVSGVLVHNRSVQGVETAHGAIRSTTVVIAGGAWSASLLRDTGLGLPVTPVRGQMIQFKARPGLLQHIVLDGDHYLVPRRDGLILAGSTLEHVGFDKSTTQAAHDLLRERALQLIPVLADCPIVRHWAGLRPGSADGIPLIDEHPQIQGLYVNTGHYRNGVGMAPASARLLVDRMLQRQSFTGFAPYSLKRS